MSNIFYSVNKILQANVKKKVSYKMLYTTKNIQLVQGYPNICREYFRKKGSLKGTDHHKVEPSVSEMYKIGVDMLANEHWHLVQFTPVIRLKKRERNISIGFIFFFL